ncbi:glycosyltransferase family 4 protein [Massilia forsythiae]|nr:glycosyltransferase family 4 protein [Massilia forsythiae]
MRAAPPRVLMAGTAPEGRGGVAAVVSVLRRHGLFERERVRYVATHADGGHAAKARYALAGLGRCAWLCLAQRPAVVHVHAASHASFARKAALLLVARLAGCRTVFHLHGGGFRRFATEEAGSLQRRWIRHTLERSSAVVTLSEGWAGFVREFAPAARTVVVPNPVALPAAPEPAPDPQRILFLGRIEAAKGVFELLAAGARLAPAFPALRLVFAGAGDEDALAALRRRAGELRMLGRIELPGWLGPGARDAELARAGLFCLPSHAEGLPMAMLEAMAAGRAVVASRVGAVPEALRDGDNGLLVAPGDVDALAAALASALGDAALRARLGRRARATVAAHYSTEVVCGRLSALYRELAGTRR